MKILITLLLIAGTIIFAAANPREPLYWLLPAGFVAGLISLILEKRARQLRPAPTSVKHEDWDLVKVTVKRPVMPVLSIQEAYGTLPPHCDRVLS